MLTSGYARHTFRLWGPDLRNAPHPAILQVRSCGQNPKREIEEIHSTYKQIEAESQHWLCHSQKTEASEALSDTRDDQRARFKGQRGTSRSYSQTRSSSAYDFGKPTGCSAFLRDFATWKTKNQKYIGTQKAAPPALPPRGPKVHIHLQTGLVQASHGGQRQSPNESIQIMR